MTGGTCLANQPVNVMYCTQLCFYNGDTDKWLSVNTVVVKFISLIKIKVMYFYSDFFGQHLDCI